MKSLFCRHAFNKMFTNNQIEENDHMIKQNNEPKGVVRHIETKMETLFLIYKDKFDKV